MRGLIIKDFLTLKSTWKNIVVMFIGSVLISYPLGNFTIAIVTVPMALLTSGITTFQTDEFYNTISYTLSGPYSRTKVITARYIYTILIALISFLIGGIIFTLINFILHPSSVALNVQMLGFLIMLELAGLVVDAVFYPIIYKYGCEKARFVLLSIIMLLLGIVAIITVTFNIIDLIHISWEPTINWIEKHGLLVLSLFSTISMVISYFVSILFFKKRDF